MNMLNDEYKKLNNDISGIIGNRAWNARIGHGSFLTIEFGNPIVFFDEECHGEWHLWAYMCPWRIEKEGAFLAGSEDPNEVMMKAAKMVEGCKLTSFNIVCPSFETILSFEQEIVLKLFPVYSDHNDNVDIQHWMLYMPNNKVLVTGPGSRWIIEDARAGG